MTENVNKEEVTKETIEYLKSLLIKTIYQLHKTELNIFIVFTEKTNNVEKTARYLEPYNFGFKFESSMFHPFKDNCKLTSDELKIAETTYISVIKKIQNRTSELSDILNHVIASGNIDDCKLDGKIGLAIFIPKEQIRQDILDTLGDDFLYAIIVDDILIEYNYMILYKESVVEKSFDKDIRKKDDKYYE